MNPPYAINTRHTGKPDIGQRNVWRTAGNPLKRLLHGIVLAANRESRGTTDQQAQPFPGDMLIFDERHANRLRHV